MDFPLPIGKVQTFLESRGSISPTDKGLRRGHKKSPKNILTRAGSGFLGQCPPATPKYCSTFHQVNLKSASTFEYHGGALPRGGLERAQKNRRTEDRAQGEGKNPLPWFHADLLSRGHSKNGGTFLPRTESAPIV